MEDNTLQTVFINLFCTALGAAIAKAAFWVRKKYTAKHFRNVFGDDALVPARFHVVYGELKSDATALSPTVIKNPTASKTIDGRRAVLLINEVVAISEMKSAHYINEAFIQAAGSGPALTSDEDMKTRVNYSGIALGSSASNLKTADIIDAHGRSIIMAMPDAFVSPVTNRKLYEKRPNHDYGLILKINPVQFQDRVQIACIGLGHTGTMAAAWYLANCWSKIEQLHGNRVFALIVEAKQGQAESARIVFHSESKDEAESAADKIVSGAS